MKKSEKIFADIKKNRLIALLTPNSKKDCVAAYEICSPSGIILEIAIRSEYAIDGIKSILNKYPDALVLAGTVMTPQQAEEAIEAGAAGVVSADYIPAVVDVCVQRDVMCVPGGLSDVGKQLVQKADSYGCSLEDLREKYPYQWVYKLFPAISGRLSHMDLPHSWKGPFKDVAVIYTGGITIETIKETAGKDPDGIFCASALTKHLDEPEKMKAEIKLWKDILKPEVSQSVTPKPEKLPGDILAPRIVTFGEMLI